MMDLAKFDAIKENSEKGEWMEIENPASGEPLGMKLRLLGSDSDAYRRQQRRLQDKRLKKGFKNIKAENLEAEGLELLVSCTTDWEGIVYQGNTMEFNKDNVRWLYKTYPWIKDQVDEFIGDRANFLGE